MKQYRAAVRQFVSSNHNSSFLDIVNFIVLKYDLDLVEASDIVAKITNARIYKFDENEFTYSL
jgi:hypothetical protein